MYDLTGFQRNLLYVTAGLDEPHGLALKEELENYYEKEIYHGRLYRIWANSSIRGSSKKARLTAGRTYIQ